MYKILFPLLILLHTSLVSATDLPEVVKSCLATNTPETTSAQTSELRARDRGGYESIMQANVYQVFIRDEWNDGQFIHSSKLSPEPLFLYSHQGKSSVASSTPGSSMRAMSTKTGKRVISITAQCVKRWYFLSVIERSAETSSVGLLPAVRQFLMDGNTFILD